MFMALLCQIHKHIHYKPNEINIPQIVHVYYIILLATHFPVSQFIRLEVE